MAKKKPTKDKTGRKRYLSESRKSQNKSDNIEKAAAKLEFYTIRNEIMKHQKIGKSAAKRVARLVLQGLDEAEAMKFASDPRVGDTPTDKE